VATIVAVGLTLVVVMSPTSAGPGIGGIQPSSDSISISMFTFSPARLVVAPGALVRVTNADSVTHTLTAIGSAFNTGDINEGQTVDFTAPLTPGTYDYDCSIHPFMHGVLVVS
jgi:plastocyanin